MGDNPVLKYFIDRSEGIYYVTIFREDKNSTTIGRGSNTNRKTAIKLALNDLEKNLKLVEIVHKNDEE